MSGALKHFFDQVYYPCLDQTAGLPFGLYVHGGSDVAGAVRDIMKITGALGWEQAAEVCESTGAIGTAEREAAWELGATVALRAVEAG
jgi:multimeric flavodoxin WrbA